MPFCCRLSADFKLLLCACIHPLFLFVQNKRFDDGDRVSRSTGDDAGRRYVELALRDLAAYDTGKIWCDDDSGADDIYIFING